MAICVTIAIVFISKKDVLNSAIVKIGCSLLVLYEVGITVLTLVQNGGII